MISYSLLLYLEVRNSSLFHFSPLLQVRQALAQQQATQVGAQQAGIPKRIEAEATKRAEELVKTEKETQKQKSPQHANATKQVEDFTTPQGSAGGRSPGAQKRQALLTPLLTKVPKKHGELRAALGIVEAQLGTPTQQCGSVDGTRPSRVKKSTAAGAVRSVSSDNEARSPDHDIAKLDSEESVAERVARRPAQQAEAGKLLA